MVLCCLQATDSTLHLLLPGSNTDALLWFELKYSTLAHKFKNTWSLVGGAILEGCGTFRWQSLGRSRSLGVGFEVL